MTNPVTYIAGATTRKLELAQGSDGYHYLRINDVNVLKFDDSNKPKRLPVNDPSSGLDRDAGNRLVFADE
jgi:hypothetical protein